MEQCKACLKEIKIIRINKHTHKPEELCSECLTTAFKAAYNIEDDDILEALAPEVDKKYE